MAAPFQERARSFLEQVMNPYTFRVGDVTVKLEFTPGGRPLEDALRSYLLKIKK